MKNEIAGVESLAYVFANVEFVATDVELGDVGVDSLVVDVDEGLLLKHYIQFVLGCENVDWVTDMYLILMF